MNPSTGLESNTVTNGVLQPIADKTSTGEFDISPMTESHTFEMFVLLTMHLHWMKIKEDCLFILRIETARINECEYYDKYTTIRIYIA